MEFDDLLEEPNLDDIIAQHIDDDIGDTDINVDDLLNDDLATSILQSPANTMNATSNTTTIDTTNDTDNDNNNQYSQIKPKPQLTSSLPKPISPPKTDENNKTPDLPSTVSRYSVSTSNSNNPNNNNAIKSPQSISTTQSLSAQEHELDIETILNDSKMDDDLLGDTSINDIDIDNNNDNNDPLLEFDPYGIGIEDMKSSTDITNNNDIDGATSDNKLNINKISKYSDIDLESIDNLLKREEIRMKQRMECGNYEMIEPLTKRMNNRNTNNSTSKHEESFFKLELKESITKTLEHHKSEYGPPTVISIHTKFIAMGMKNGSVFIFDHFEQLKVELTPPDLKNLKMGSVTSLDFNYNGTNLIVGYFGGQLVLWDIINKKELKKIKDAHSSPIIFVMFYRRGTLRIASCDSNGIMFTWSFSKIFFSYQVDRSTLFNGKRAGILYDIALYKTNPNNRHILDTLSLCAVANNESVFFVTLEPPFTLKQTILLPNTNINDIKRGALPMLAWRLSYSSKVSNIKKTNLTPTTTQSVQSRKNSNIPSPSPPPPTSLPPPLPGSSRKSSRKSSATDSIPPTATDNNIINKKKAHFKTFNPVLAVGSGTVIQLIEIFIRDENRFNQTRDTSLIRMRGIGQIQLDKLVIAMKWLNEENLIILTANDEICICNGWPLEISETIWPIPKTTKSSSYQSLISISPSSSPSNLSYTKQSKPIKKISMDFFIRHQYFGKNIICFKNCLEIIGGLDRTGQTNKLMIITNTNVVTAHCMTWYDRIDRLIREGEWIKACCLIIKFYNLFQCGSIQQSQSVRKLLSKMDVYILQFCEFVVQSNKISDDELESFGGVAMDYCVCLNRTETLLFDKVYKILLNNGGREIFFKLLEPYILNDRITTLPPEFMQNFADFMVSKSKINELEQIILHLSPQSFDIHQIVSICRQHKLFIALCYLYNEACLNYSDPIKDMFYKIIHDTTNDDNFTAKTNNLNEIIQRGYQLLLYLKYTMNGTTFPWCNVLITPLKAKQQILNELFDTKQQYRILRHSLALDLKEVLFNIIKIAFDDKHLFRSYSTTSSSNTSSPNPNINNNRRRSSSNSIKSFEHDLTENNNNNNNNNPSFPMKRRTSIQIKGMLSNAQSAVMTGAKWAWSTATLNATGSRNNSPNASRRNSMTGIGSKLPSIDVIEAAANNNNIATEDVLDSTIQLKSKQEMLNILVKIIIDEENSAIKDELKSVKQREREIFYEFCTPLLASGECEVNIILLKCVLDYLFSESLKLLDKIEKVNKNYQYQQQQQQQKEDKTNIQNLKRIKRELETLIFTQNNFENTILILLSRKMETNNKDFNMNELLRKAKQCSFHKVELYLHRECGNHAAVIDSYLADKDLQIQVFDYINNLFYDIKQEIEQQQQQQNNNNDNYVVNPHPNNRMIKHQQQNISNNKFISVIQIVLKRLIKLVLINAQQCGQLIFTWFPQYFDNTVAALQNNRKTQYIFLKQIVKSMHSLQNKQLNNNNNNNNNDNNNNNNDNITNLERLLLSNKFEFEQKQHELYIRLLCEFESESVLSYISTNSEKFDIELIERYCEKYQVLDASAYLRERSGDSIGALQLILKSIDNGICNLWDIFKSDYDNKKIKTSNVKNNSYYINCIKINKIMDELNMAIGLCQRHTSNNNNNNNNTLIINDNINTLWNHLLDSCLVSQQKINNQIKTPSYRHKYPSSEIRHLMKQTVNDIVSKTLTAMMTEKNIDLCDMFEKLVDKESSEKYEYYRDTIDVMLSTYKYETQMLKTANNLFRNGFHNTYKYHVNTAAAAYKTDLIDDDNNNNDDDDDDGDNDKYQYEICKICDSFISDLNPKRLRLFYCGHLFHEHCLYTLQKKRNSKMGGNNQFGLNNDDNNLCPICYLNTDIKVSSNNKNNELSEKQKKLKEQKQREQEQNIQVQMKNYAKKLHRLKQRIRSRDKLMEISKKTKYVSLSLAPGNKASLPKSKPLNMHIPVANWDIQFENNRHKACVIQVD